MVEQMTDTQLKRRLDWVEKVIAACTDPKSLPALNAAFQRLLDEQVRRDLQKEKKDD